MGVDAVYYCETCNLALKPGSRAIEGSKLRELLNGEVTQEKIDKVISIQKQLRNVFDEEWLFDYYDLCERYDLSDLISFLREHIGHNVIITDDHTIGWIVEEFGEDVSYEY